MNDDIRAARTHLGLPNDPAVCSAYSYTSDVAEGGEHGDTQGKATGRPIACTRTPLHPGDHLAGAWAWRNEGGVPFRHDGRWLRGEERAFLKVEQWLPNTGFELEPEIAPPPLTPSVASSTPLIPVMPMAALE